MDADASADRRDEKSGLADGGNHVIDGDMVFRLADRIEIAKIQLNIQTTLNAIVEPKERTASIAAAQKEPEKDDKEKERRVRMRMAVGELDHELFDLDNVCVASIFVPRPLSLLCCADGLPLCCFLCSCMATPRPSVCGRSVCLSFTSVSARTRTK